MRLPIGCAVFLAMLMPLAAMGGALASPSFPEVATPGPLGRYVTAAMPPRRLVCPAGKRCHHHLRRLPASLPPAP